MVLIIYNVGVPSQLNETVCQSKYSKLAPSTKGEVRFQWKIQSLDFMFLGHLQSIASKYQVQLTGIQSI